MLVIVFVYLLAVLNNFDYTKTNTLNKLHLKDEIYYLNLIPNLI